MCNAVVLHSHWSAETSDGGGGGWNRDTFNPLRLYIQNDFEAGKKLHNVALKKELF